VLAPGVRVLTTLFANIELFYLTVWIITCVFCVIARTRDYFLAAFLLGIMYFFGQFPMWGEPLFLLLAHIGIFYIMLGAFRDEKYQIILRRIVLAMIVTDAIWTTIPGGLFWYQSILNLLYLSLCVVTMTGCYYHIKDNPQRRRDLKRREVHNNSKVVDIGISVSDVATRSRPQ